MFQVVSSSLSQNTSLAAEHWELETVVSAVRMLGWRGEVRGPVNFAGVRFVSVSTDEPIGAPGAGWLIGCVVPGVEARTAVQAASLLAGYSPRAVLVRECADVVDLQLETALLDQGAVLDSDGELTLLSEPGPVVPSPLQDVDTWQTDATWLSLHEAITSATRLARVH